MNKLIYVLVVLVIHTTALYAQANGSNERTFTLYTGDDCDKIDITVRYNKDKPIRKSSNDVDFIFVYNSAIESYKKISIPLNGGGYQSLVRNDLNKNNNVFSIKIARGYLNWSGKLKFTKGKFLGVPTELKYTQLLKNAIGNQDLSLVESVSFFWAKDRCN
jgi:hypothetical protein